MNVANSIVSLVLAMGLGVVGARAQATAPESLDAARKLYASAAYEEALAMLERVKADNPPHGMVARRDLEATRALCLLALGRERDARQAMEAVVFIDPQFEFDERDAAPRVRALLEDTRAKRLPQIIRQRYSEARQAYDNRRYDEATARFDSVLVLLDDPVLRQASDYETMQDLAILAREFHGLSNKASTVAATPPAITGQPGTGQSGEAGGAAGGQPPAADSVGTGRPAGGTPAPGPVAGAPGTAMPPSAASPAQTTAAGPASITTPSSSSGAAVGGAAAGTPPPVQEQPPASQAAGSSVPAAAPAAQTPSPSGSAPSSPSPSGPPASGAAPPGSASSGTTFPSIVAPLPIEQPVPAWSEDFNLEPGRSYQATVEVVIDEIGRVTSARVLDSINPVYDARLVEAVRRWRYRPGTRAGVPVRFTKLVTVTVEAR